MSFEKYLHLPNLYKDKKNTSYNQQDPPYFPPVNPTPHKQPLFLFSFLPTLLAYSRMSYKWNHTVCTFCARLHWDSYHFLLLNKVHYMIIAQFFYSYVSWHLNYFQFWAIMNKITINTHTLSFLLSRYLEVEVMGHRVSLCLVL